MVETSKEYGNREIEIMWKKGMNGTMRNELKTQSLSG